MFVFQRVIAPLLLLMAGLACLGFGVVVHHMPVTHEQQEDVPLPPPPPLWGAAPFGDGPAELLPPFDPRPFMDQVQQTLLVTEMLREAWLLRETTVGGVTRLPSGELRRTYTGDAPSLCPT